MTNMFKYQFNRNVFSSLPGSPIRHALRSGQLCFLGRLFLGPLLLPLVFVHLRNQEFADLGQCEGSARMRLGRRSQSGYLDVQILVQMGVLQIGRITKCLLLGGESEKSENASDKHKHRQTDLLGVLHRATAENCNATHSLLGQVLQRFALNAKDFADKVELFGQTN